VSDRPSAIPGPAIDEIVVPVTESIGVRLLLKMGWRHGRVIGPKHIAAAPGKTYN
jgi:G patch domain-containing protein 1